MLKEQPKGEEEIEVYYIRNKRFFTVFSKVEQALKKQNYNTTKDTINLDILKINELETTQQALYYASDSYLYLHDDSLYRSMHDLLIEFIKTKKLYACDIMKNPYFDNQYDIVFFVDRKKKKKRKFKTKQDALLTCNN